MRSSSSSRCRADSASRRFAEKLPEALKSPNVRRVRLGDLLLQTGQQMQYELLQVTPEKLETAVRQFQRTGGKGLNITVPHKRAVLDLVDQLSERAATAGA